MANGASADVNCRTIANDRERISNFMAIPLAIEKVCPSFWRTQRESLCQITLFGALLCLDGFLYNFTVLPIRAFFAVFRIISRIFGKRTIPPAPIPPQHIHSILRMLLLVIPTVVLMYGTDSSKMYHTVRGQDTIKLYVIFNALEVSDLYLIFAVHFGATDDRLQTGYAVHSDRMFSTLFLLAKPLLRPREKAVEVGNDSRLGRTFSLPCLWAMSVSLTLQFESTGIIRWIELNDSGAHLDILLHAGLAHCRH